MSHNLLEQLAQSAVPPVPERFDEQLHERLNKTLLWTHLADFFVHGFVYAIGHFARAVAGLIVMTLSGRFEEGRRRPPSAP
jgi:hypothetical protein